MKKCNRCNTEKPFSEFSKNSESKDNYINQCKECKRQYSRKKYKEYCKNILWVEKERRRQKEKHERLNYSKKYKPSKSKKRKIKYNYIKKYPEKYKAGISSRRMYREKGEQLHHWSYNEEHYKDVIPLTVRDHALLHRFLEYDEETFYYRDLEGNLLDTKEKHLELYYNIHY